MIDTTKKKSFLPDFGSKISFQSFKMPLSFMIKFMQNAIVIRSVFRICMLFAILLILILSFYICFNFLSFYVGSFNINNKYTDSVIFKV